MLRVPFNNFLYIKFISVSIVSMSLELVLMLYFILIEIIIVQFVSLRTGWTTLYERGTGKHIP